MPTFKKKFDAYKERGSRKTPDPTREQAQALVETMVIAACVDGILAPREAQTLAELIRDTPGFTDLDNKGLSRTVEQISEGIARDGFEARVKAIAAALSANAELKDEAFLLATLFVHYDGEVGDEEQELLYLLQRELGITDERASHIDAVLAELSEQHLTAESKQ
jgi:tellurite resistance protein